MKFREMLMASLLSLSSFGVLAESLKATQFQDQHEQAIELNAQTKWLLLSSDKASGKLVKESLDALQMTDLAAKKGLYVADVSAMPSLVTKLFAIPKMQDYPFRVGIVQESAQLDAWPRQADKVSAITLNQLEIESVEYLDSAEALQAWIGKQR
ncbi:MAG: hypothetical protein JXR44_02555 [Thiotrichales bacterium]|nr:hypothetical protein [Thiotrichales bacterium]